MTEAEVQERRKPAVPESRSVEVNRERTFEELMKEVDDMQCRMDDLEEVRRNITRCRRGIEAHSQSRDQIHRVLEGLENQLRPYSEEVEVKRRVTLPPVNPHSGRMVEFKKSTDLAALD